MGRHLSGRVEPSSRRPAPAPLAVLKFGSSILDGAGGFRVAAEEVRRTAARGLRVVAVVSAPAGATEDLLRSAHDLSDRPPESLLGSLLATGEDRSVALLGIVLRRVGVGVRAVSHDELPLVTTGPLLDARPVSVDVSWFRGVLRRHDALVVPGFVGRSSDGAPSLLGRGGSDLTALFLAQRLEAQECRLLKDVDGLYRRDPNDVVVGRIPVAAGAVCRAGNARYLQATWAEMRRVGAGLVQDKALEFARDQGLRFHVAAPGSRGTEVGPGPSLLERGEGAPCRE